MAVKLMMPVDTRCEVVELFVADLVLRSEVSRDVVTRSRADDFKSILVLSLRMWPDWQNEMCVSIID